MRIDQSRVVLRPRTPSSVAELAFRFVLDLEPRRFVTLSVWVLTPGLLAAQALRTFFAWEWTWVWLFALAYVSFAQGAYTLLAGRLLFEHDVPVRQILLAYARRLLPYALVALLTRAFVVLTVPVFGLGLLLWARFAFLHEAFLLEGQTARAALTRSAALGRNSPGDTGGMLTLALCIHLASALCFEALGRGALEWLLMAPELAQPLYEAGGSPFALIGFLAATPFTATLRFLTYIDGRTKQDGWDLQVKFMQIEAAEAHR